MQHISEELALLAELELTRDLTDAARTELASHCRLEDIATKKRFNVSDSRTDRLFLVDGHAVRLSHGVGERLQSFRGLSEPVDLFGDSAGPQDCCVTETPCTLLRIDTAALADALSSGLEVSDIELDATEGDFLSELYQLINNNLLTLPARPEVALKIQELTNDPDTGIEALTEIIQADGTIAGALLHATNSPLFRAAKEIKSIRDAVVRLGFRNTRMLAVNLALRQTFKANHAVTREAMETVWAHAVLRSAYSYIIADRLKVLDRERALLAGLIADIGAVPIIEFIEMRDTHPTPESIKMLVAKLSDITGVLVINYWGLGDDLVAVAEHQNDWAYRAAAPDYASIAMVARWALLHDEGGPHPDAAEVAAFATLGIDPPAPGEPIAMLADSAEALKSLKSMFSA